jgi:hypothetical protein
MVRVVVFFGVAVVVGAAIRVLVGWRHRTVARRPDVSDADLCQLDQASRISSVALTVSLVGLAVVGLVFVVLRLS